MIYKAKNFILNIDMQYSAGIPIIDIFINSQRYKFMFDTGAFSMVSSKIIKELNLEALDEELHTIDSFGEKSVLKIYSLSSLKIKEIEFKYLHVASSDFFQQFPISCMNIDGIIGYNFLQNLIVKMDYKNSKLVISDNLKKDKTYQRVKIQFDGDYGPRFKIDFGFIDAWVGIDTGKNDGILIGDSKIISEFKKHKFESKKGKGIFSSALSGVNKSMNKETFIVKYFDIIIDFKSKYMYLKKNHNTKVDEKFANTFGFSLYWNEDEKIFISAITEKTPASSSKLQIGDRVLSLDEEDVFEYKKEDYCKYFLSNILSYELKDKIEMVIKRDNKIKKVILVKNT